MTTSAFVVVLDRSDALVHGLAKAVDGLDAEPDVHLFTKAGEVQAVFDQGPVDVLVIGPSELTGAGLRRVARWHAAHPSTVVVIASQRDALPDQLLLMKAGAEKLLALPAGAAAIRRALAGALDLATLRREQLQTAVPAEEAPPLDLEEVDEPEAEPEPELEAEPEPEPEPEPAVTITVASATGGCGKTFLATNLAYLLARGSGKRVAMIDLDLQFGEVVATLQLRPTHTIADVQVDDEGRVQIEHLMTKHVGGFDVLAAPPDPVVADAMDAATMAAVIEAVRDAYDYVIIDTPPSLNEVVLGAFDLSVHLLVLATLDVPSVRNMKVFLTTLDRLRIPTDGLHLVLNKAEKNVELSPKDIKQVLGRGWDLELPYDRQVSRAVNLGLPVVEAAPTCEVSRRLITGLDALVPGAELSHLQQIAGRTFVQRLLDAMRPPRTTLIVEEEMS